jgi:periplasmic copper chaperone A
MRSENAAMTIKALALAAAAICAATAAQAHSHKFKTLEIVHPWCIETKDAANPVAVFMTIKNSGKPDKLLRATSAIADRAELRVAGEKAVSSVGVATRSATDLKRDGPHIQLVGVKKLLSPYDSFFMTLTFARAGKVEVEVMVEEASILEPAKH